MKFRFSATSVYYDLLNKPRSQLRHREFDTLDDLLKFMVQLDLDPMDTDKYTVAVLNDDIPTHDPNYLEMRIKALLPAYKIRKPSV